jgi:hypothetical protein
LVCWCNPIPDSLEVSRRCPCGSPIRR